MSVSVSMNGNTFTIPSTRGETGWATQVTTWIQSVSSNTLQKVGGTFTLTADINFGTSYGVTAKFFAATSYVDHSEVAAPSTPSAGVVRAYAKTDKNLYYKDSTGAERQLATGSSSGINYAAGTSSDFESSIGSWLTYADGSATPVDMTGGSPTATFTQSSSSPLRGTYSGLYTASGTIGQGVALAVTVPRADFAAPIEISFDYEIGTPGSFTDGDVAIWVYDVTNSTLIQPAPYLLPKCTGQEKFTAYFQSSATGTSYRVGIHQATANTGYTVKIDNVQIGPVKSNELGTIVTDYQSYTPTLSTGAFGTNTNSFKWRRVGDSVQILGQINQTGAGTTGSGTYYLSLPSGMASDTTKITASTNEYQSAVGSFTGTGTTLGQSKGTVFLATTTTFGFAYVNESTHANWTSATQPLGDASVLIGFILTIPISGWSSSSVSSSADYSTRIVAARYTTATAGTYAAGTVLDFGTLVTDTHSAVTTGAAWKFTCPVAGKYKVTAKVRQQAAAAGAAGENYALVMTKNGTDYSVLGECISQNTTSLVWPLGGSDEIDLIAGEYIQFYMDGYTGNRPLTTNALYNHVSIEKMSGPSQVLPSESVNARYTTTAGQSIADNAAAAIIDFGTKTYSSHDGLITTGASWKFTANISGKFDVNAQVAFPSNSWTAGDGFVLYLYKNGSFYSFLDIVYLAATRTYSGLVLRGKDSISLLAGEYIDIRIVQDNAANTARTLDVSAGANYVTINRTGN